MVAIVFSPYQLVLSRRVAGVYAPRFIYQFHLPPTSLSYRPEQTYEVTALIGGVHVESGVSRIGTIDLDIKAGVGQALSTRHDGFPLVTNGQDRARELRKFFELVGRALTSGEYRLEFHSDTRRLHYEVVPENISFSADSASSSRIGGMDSSITLRCVGDLQHAVSVMGNINEFVASAREYFMVASGVIAGGVTVAERFIGVAGTSKGLVIEALNVSKFIIETLNKTTDTAAALLDIKKDTIETWRDLCHKAADGSANKTLKRALRAIGTVADAASIVAQQSTGALSLPESPGYETAESGQKFGVPEGEEIKPKGAFAAMDWPFAYSGWVPYTPEEFETLLDISKDHFGTQNKWPVIAKANGLVDPFAPLDGSVIKLPVKNGGLPFSSDSGSSYASIKKAAEEAYFYRDIKIAPAEDSTGHSELGDLVIDKSNLVDILTVTGPKNYEQRYEMLVFPTELGSNGCFPEVGVYLGVGQKNLIETRHLTRDTAQQQLLSDPRTSTVDVSADKSSSDTRQIAFDVKTGSGQDALLIEVT